MLPQGIGGIHTGNLQIVEPCLSIHFSNRFRLVVGLFEGSSNVNWILTDLRGQKHIQLAFPVECYRQDQASMMMTEYMNNHSNLVCGWGLERYHKLSCMHTYWLQALERQGYVRIVEAMKPLKFPGSHPLPTRPSSKRAHKMISERPFAAVVKEIAERCGLKVKASIDINDYIDTSARYNSNVSLDRVYSLADGMWAQWALPMNPKYSIGYSPNRRHRWYIIDSEYTLTPLAQNSLRGFGLWWSNGDTQSHRVVDSNTGLIGVRCIKALARLHPKIERICAIRPARRVFPYTLSVPRTILTRIHCARDGSWGLNLVTDIE